MREKASPLTGGVLEPASYEYDPQFVAGRRYQLYDFELKNVGSDAVNVRVPASIHAGSSPRLLSCDTLCPVAGLIHFGKLIF